MQLLYPTYLVNSSNLLKATMAPMRWLSGEKPLSMKSSVLCLSRSGLEMLMGMAILQGDKRQRLRQLVLSSVQELFLCRTLWEAGAG